MSSLEKELNTVFKDEWVKALLNIKYTSGWFDQLGHKALSPYNISEQQYNILRILRGAKKAITVNTVRDRMVQKSPNITRLMDKLCEKALIDRSRCENDRRVVYVKIAEPGLKLLEDIDLSSFDVPLRKISEEEARELNRILDKLR